MKAPQVITRVFSSLNHAIFNQLKDPLMQTPGILTQIAATLLALLSFTAGSQSFEKIEIPIENVWGPVEWVDLDNDRDLDIICAGMIDFPLVYGTFVYENINGGYEFRATSLPGLFNGGFSAADYDHDGDMDIAISGHAGSGNISALYENEGGFQFTFKTAFFPLLGSRLRWFDIDNDLDLDLFIFGEDDTDTVHAIASKVIFYENNNGLFTELENTNIPLLGAGAVEIADFNNDGYVDIFLGGYQGHLIEGVHTDLFLNGKNRTFSRDTLSDFTTHYLSDVAIGDTDNDGDIDLLVSGVIADDQPGQTYETLMYENVEGHLRPIIDQGFRGVGENSYGGNNLVDIDNDHDLDIAISGYAGGDQQEDIMRFYRNDGSNTFTEFTALRFQVSHTSLHAADYDNDGDFDLLANGGRNGMGLAAIYKNNFSENTPAVINTSPQPPTSGFSAKAFRNSLWLSSGQGSDIETPVNALSYNFYLNSPVSNIVAPPVDLTSGNLLTSNLPNGFSNTLVINGVPEGELTWAVQSIDGGSLGSSFSSEQSLFHLNGPTAKSIRIIDSVNFKVDWENQSEIETEVIIQRSASSPSGYVTIATEPANSTTYTDNFSFQPEVYYHYRVFNSDGIHQSPYDSFQIVLPHRPTALVAEDVNATTMLLTWSDMSAYETGYVIERALDTEEIYSVIDTVATDITQFHDTTGLEEGTSYSYRIRAMNAFGYSGYSNTAVEKTNFFPGGEGFMISFEEDSVLSIVGFDTLFSDPDGDSFHGIYLLQLPPAALGFVVNADGNVDDEALVLADKATSLKFHPAADANGETFIVFKYSDGKDLATETDTVFISIIPVSDPPRSIEGNIELVTLEDVTLAVEGFDTLFSDPDGDAFHGIRIEVLPDTTLGVFKNADGKLAEGEVLSSDMTASLVFHPAENVNGQAFMVFKFFDGIEFAALADTVFISIDPVNDPPVLSSFTDLEFIEGESEPEPLSFTVTDVDNDIASILVRANTSNHALVASESLAIEGSGNDRMLYFELTEGVSGRATVEVIADDGISTDTSAFLVKVLLITGTENHASARLHVYPVPFENSVTVDLNKAAKGPRPLIIRNSMGEVIKQLTLTEQKSHVNLSELSAGLYFFCMDGLWKKVIKR